MNRHNRSRRWFLKTSAALAGMTPLAAGLLHAQSNRAGRPLIAYVGTFSSPLRDVLPTQVDLPPGNGRGIHLFQVDRATGALAPAGIHEMQTSPTCLALNAAGTRLYSTNETDRVGEGKEGTVSAFSIDRADGHLTLLNTVRSGGTGPTHASIHPSGRFLLVANYRGGCVAVLLILPDGRLDNATDVKNDAGTIGPTRATSGLPGSAAFRHDRPRAHDSGPTLPGRFVPYSDLALINPVWKIRRAERRADLNGPPLGCRPAMVHAISAFYPNGRWLY